MSIQYDITFSKGGGVSRQLSHHMVVNVIYVMKSDVSEKIVITRECSS